MILIQNNVTADSVMKSVSAIKTQINVKSRHFYYFFAWSSIKSFASLILAARYGDPPVIKGKYSSLNILILWQGYMRLQTEGVKSFVFAKNVTKLVGCGTNNESAAYPRGTVFHLFSVMH